jgi:hypothetical protein
MSNSATIIDMSSTSSQGHTPSDPVIHQYSNGNGGGGGGHTGHHHTAHLAPNGGNPNGGGQQQQQQTNGVGGGGGVGGGAPANGANNNNNGNNNNNNNGTTTVGANDGTATILARLKELESTNQQLAKHLEDVKVETQRKEDKIKLLSADKRKDMEQMIETAIDTWLNSLTGISEEVRKQFRSGVSRIAEQADLKNAAWEVVCQASQLHRSNVDRIEELLQTCNSQNETIKSLVGSGGAHDPTFATEASRLLNQHKRQRTDGGGGAEGGGGASSSGAAALTTASSSSNAAGTTEPGAGKGPKDAWDMFDSMLREDSRSQYYSY